MNRPEVVFDGSNFQEVWDKLFYDNPEPESLGFKAEGSDWWKDPTIVANCKPSLEYDVWYPVRVGDKMYRNDKGEVWLNLDDSEEI